MSTVITKQRLTEIINEELNLVVESTYSKLLTENNILNIQQVHRVSDEKHTVKITGEDENGDYGIIFDGDLYDIKAYAKRMWFFLRPLKARRTAGGLELSFQPIKVWRNAGEPKDGFMKNEMLDGILDKLASSGIWEGEFETLDDDGTVAQVMMKIEKA
jgi:hypothetical protein